MKFSFVYATLARSVVCPTCGDEIERGTVPQTFSVKVGSKDWAVFAEADPPSDVALIADCRRCAAPVRLQTPIDAVLSTDRRDPRSVNVPSIQMYRYAAARW